MVSLDAESHTVWEETLETWAWLSIVWNARARGTPRAARRDLADACGAS